ncbi:MAG: hypothetical protein WCK27_07235 [Verrucomicrobiota bacterium]|nr:hypothetical protein [Verrucomicrobiota bacterium]
MATNWERIARVSAIPRFGKGNLTLNSDTTWRRLATLSTQDKAEIGKTESRNPPLLISAFCFLKNDPALARALDLLKGLALVKR